MKQFLARAGAVAGGLVLSAALLAGCSDRGVEPPREDITTAATQEAASTLTAAPPTATPVNTQTSASNLLTVEEVVEAASPAIVRIETGGGVGTGFIVGADGYIVTNNHVVEAGGGFPASTVSVTLSDGDVVSGRVIGTDPRSDLALVKIDGGTYPTLPLGDLDQVQIGQDVVAIGYALDLQQGEGPSFSVTRGIISQKNRAISESAPILGAIQTDAAINHGNSGGPLLNLYGEVVGVNTALAPDPNSASGIAQGIGFAVGVDTVKAVWEQLRDIGLVDRGFLGVRNFESLRPAQARDLGIPEDTGGIYLSSPDSVMPSGPGGQAGLVSGDVITKIADDEVASEADLAVAMIENAPGTTVEVEVFRGSERLTFDVTLGSPD